MPPTHPPREPQREPALRPQDLRPPELRMRSPTPEAWLTGACFGSPRAPGRGESGRGSPPTSRTSSSCSTWLELEPGASFALGPQPGGQGGNTEASSSAPGWPRLQGWLGVSPRELTPGPILSPCPGALDLPDFTAGAGALGGEVLTSTTRTGVVQSITNTSGRGRRGALAGGGQHGPDLHAASHAPGRSQHTRLTSSAATRTCRPLPRPGHRCAPAAHRRALQASIGRQHVKTGVLT